MGFAAAFITFPPNGAKYVKNQSLHPNEPALTHLHNDGPGRVVQEQMHLSGLAAICDEGTLMLQLPLWLCSGGACKKKAVMHTSVGGHTE